MVQNFSKILQEVEENKTKNASMCEDEKWVVLFLPKQRHFWLPFLLFSMKLTVLVNHFLFFFLIFFKYVLTV